MSVEIRPVASPRDLRRFIRLPFALYRNEPRWIAPLLSDVRKRLDKQGNPFFHHAEAEYFLAWREGRPVGRISAHIDHRFNEFQDNAWGLFGFFECEDDKATAHALLGAAEGWLRERGRDRMVGPMDFTTNDECGLLVEGFERPPMILSSWHHPYYQALLEGGDLQKVMDLLMWSLHISGRDKVRRAIWRMAENVESEHGIVCRPMRKRDMNAEVERFLEVYNAAWERNWFPDGEPASAAAADGGGGGGGDAPGAPGADAMYPAPVREAYTVLRDTGQFRDGLVPDMPPSAGMVRWDF